MKKKVIVIGGGVAGLSAGIYSALNGFDTEIIEMHSITGGQCTAWERKGYRFDYCIHWLAGTRIGPFHDIWQETNALNDNVKIIDHDIQMKICSEDGGKFILYTDLDRWEKYLIDLAPEDERKIRKMCNKMRKSAFLTPFIDPPGLRKPFQVFSSAIKMLPIFMIFIKHGRNNCDDYFRKLNFSNKTLVYYLNSIYGSRDFSAMAFLMMFAWFNQKNAGYPMGGSLHFAQRMTEKFLSLGGKLTTRTKVSKINVVNNEAKGVILSDGSEIKADYVISAADGYSTIFRMLEGKYLSKKISDAYEKWELFVPIVQVSFGINRKIESDTPSEVWLAEGTIIGRTKTVFGYTIMNYCFDHTMATEGKTVIVLRYESPWSLWKDMGEADYKREKEQIETDARALLEKHIHGISACIEVTDVATPLTDIRYTGVWKAAYEGFLPSSKNMMNNLGSRLPGLRKFYMAGQWLFPGGGLPPSGQSGKWAVQYICKEEKQIFRSR